MLNSRDARRRWFGAFFLIVAMGMLVWGLTVLQPHLDRRTFVIYWLTCFGFTGLALLTALIDVIVVGKRTRQQKRELFRKAFAEEPVTGVETDLQDRRTKAH